MKKRLFLFIAVTLFLSLVLKAQSETTQETGALDSKHLQFQGVSMEGTIDDFTERLKPRFQLKRKMGSDRQWIYYGFIFGKETYFQVDYTKKSRTVYRVTIMPKHIDEQTWIDSLNYAYGASVDTEMGILWKRPEGTILFRTLEGYDPALILLDKVGQSVLKEEK